MKFNLFSSKQRNKKTDLNDATDFLNPADLNSAEGLGSPKKFRRKKGGSSKLKSEAKVKEKKVKKNDRIVKAEKKEQNKKNIVSDKRENEQLEKVQENITKEIETKPVSVKDEKEIEAIISQFEKERQDKLNKKTPDKLEEKIEKKTQQEDKKVNDIDKDEFKSIKKNISADSIFVKSRIQEINKGSDRDDFFNQDKILEINLVKDQISVFFDWYKNLAFLFIFIFLSFLLVVEVYWALSWWQNYNQNASNYNHNSSSLVSLSQEIREIKGPADEALAFEKQMSRVAYLLDNHIYWTEFFNYLEDNTLEGVKYINFSGDLSGKYSLSSVASDYPLVGRQAQRYFTSDLVSNVSVDSASLQIQTKKIMIEGPDGEMVEGEETFNNVNFTLDLEILPEIFKK